MTPNHQQHLNTVLERILSRVSSKYKAGLVEHGGHLKDDYTALELAYNAFDEAIDQCVYIVTIIQKLEEASDSPPSDPSLGGGKPIA